MPTRLSANSIHASYACPTSALPISYAWPVPTFVFTVVTIIFLPLNFVSSFFGMNVSDIRTMTQTQVLFWVVALCVTTGVVTSSLFLAFWGSYILEKMALWWDVRREQQLSTTTLLRQTLTGGAENTFRVFGVDRDERYS